MTVRRWELGVREPKADDIRKICKILNCTEAELLNGADEQEFEVKILMGVKALTGVSGLEITDNSFVYGVQDDKPQIHLAGKVFVGTPEERAKALEMIIKKFHEACWMFDHQDDAAAAAGKE